jgi:protein-L-isoaspartate(D-aspartate) O-methyltransferase
MNFDYLRERMVNENLFSRGIKNERVLNAFKKVPREFFVPEDKKENAYEDHPLTIGKGQTISQPFIVAYMVEKLDLYKKSVLEIGTGSGYQTAILAEIFEEVYTIEKIRDLQIKAKNTLEKLNYNNIYYKNANGITGWEEKTFDNIIVSAAARNFPEKLIKQLKKNGKMMIPVGEFFSQYLYKITKISENEIKKDRLIGVRFVPLVDD